MVRFEWILLEWLSAKRSDCLRDVRCSIDCCSHTILQWKFKARQFILDTILMNKLDYLRIYDGFFCTIVRENALQHTEIKSHSKLDYNEHSFDVRLFWRKWVKVAVGLNNLNQTNWTKVNQGSSSGQNHFMNLNLLLFRLGALLNLRSCKMWIITTVYYLNIWK